MDGSEIIEELLSMKDIYPEELQDLFIEQDETYINKYSVGFNNYYEFNNFREGDIYETLTIIDKNISYEYDTRLLIYIKIKENGLPMDVYYNKVINGLNNEKDGYVKALLRLISV